MNLKLQLGWLVIVAISKESFVYLANINSQVGPYRVIPGHFEHCPKEMEAAEPIEFYLTGWRDRKNTNMWYYSGNFTTTFEWNDNLSVDMRMASWSSRGGWKDNAHVLKLKHVCQAMRDYLPNFNRSIMKLMYGDENRSCPFPPGTYVITNKTTEIDVQPVPAFFYGKWRIDFTMFEPETQKRLACIRFFVETVPRLD